MKLCIIYVYLTCMRYCPHFTSIICVYLTCMRYCPHFTSSIYVYLTCMRYCPHFTTIICVYLTCMRYYPYFASIISSPCQRLCELLPSLGIRRLSSVNFSHFNLLLWNCHMNWNLVGSIYGRSSIKIAHFVPIH